MTGSRVGFVGLGRMGEPMVRNLLKAGFPLALCDAERARAERLAAEAASAGADATVPDSLAALGAAADAVVTMLPDGRIVRAVVMGEGANDGLVAGLAKGALVIDMSSSSPVGTRALGALLAERGIRLVDAPVSGGVKRAVDGSLAIMAGGAPEDVEAARPILAALGRQVFHAGPLGCGHAIKALNNYLSAAGLLAAGEALRVGEKFGLQPETMVDIWNASTGRNNATEVKFKQFIIPRTWAAGFSLGLMAKDLRTAMEVAEATGETAAFGAECTRIFNAAEAMLGGEADHTEVVRWLGLAAGDDTLSEGGGER